MSEKFEFRAENERWAELLRLRFNPSGGVAIIAGLDDKLCNSSSVAVIDLPAADARRLLAWLRERYPETDTGETK